MQLSSDIDLVAFDERHLRDTAAWLPAIAKLCTAHGITRGDITAFPDGSNLVAAIGERFVVKMERLPGLTLKAPWTSCSRTDKARMLEQIGAAMASVHALPVGELATLKPDGVLAAGLTAIEAHGKKAGSGPAAWLASICSGLSAAE